MASTETDAATSGAAEVSARRRRLGAQLSELATRAAVSNRDVDFAPETRPEGGDQVAAMRDLFFATDAALSTLAERVVPAPLLAVRRVNLALERLHSAPTLTDLFRAAPSELCWAGNFDRVLFSRVEGSEWVPAAWYSTDPTAPATVAFGQYVQGERFPLKSGSIEAETVRRRVTALVSDAADEGRTFPPILAVAKCDGYVVAPVVSGDGVVGLLHADAVASSRSLGGADRIAIRAFADGLGLIMERIALTDALEARRLSIHEALARAESTVAELCDAPITVGCTTPLAPALPAAQAATSQGGLTPRERDVFALLVAGATNAEIADRLTLSETTVKSHVKHILRKMRVRNRAEAIAKYLREAPRIGAMA